jgi:hypothetical protein
VLSAKGSPELRAAAIALKGVDRDLRSTINRATAQQGNEIWRSEVAAKTRRPLDEAILAKGARVASGNPPMAVAASSKRPIGKSRRLIPDERWPGYEFGTDNKNAYSKYRRRSKNGGTHTVERRTMRHLPPRYRKGRVLWPAFAESAPRVDSLWVKTIVKSVMDAAEGKD